MRKQVKSSFSSPPKFTFTIGVFAVIFDDQNRILFCHRRDYDVWNLPGGKLEKGEAPWEGVIREVKEETGLDVKAEKITGIYYKPRVDDIVIQFLCSRTGGAIQTNDEADKIEYFAFDALPRNTTPKQVERIKDLLTRPDTLHMRKQTGKSTKELVTMGLLKP